MQNGTPGSFRPQVTHVVSQMVKKGEDVVMVHPSPYQTGGSGLGYNLAVFAVADGHNGSAAALHCQEALYRELMQHMPTKPPPIAPGTDATQAYAEKLREAVTTTFLTLEGQFVLTGQLSGCTLTLILITDWLLTVAGIGDSKAVLDLGAQFLDLSPEHRVHNHLSEQDRLKRAGSYLAPISVYMDGAAEADEPGYGPLRAWPGGLCVSRAIGDMDVGECIIAHPHIMQVQIPEEGARIVVASDGLWDCFPSRKVVKMARTKDTQQAGEHIQRAAVRRQGGQISDDLTIVVIDMLPPGTTFPDVASHLTSSASNSSVGSGGKPVRTKPVQRTNSFLSFFRCGSEPVILEEFEPSFHDTSVRDPSTRGRGDYSNHADVNIIADVDSYVEFAHLSPMSVARKRHHQIPVQQQHQQLPSPFQQPDLAHGSGSSDLSTSSSMFVDNSTHAGQPQQAPRVQHRDHTTHAGDQIPQARLSLQRLSKSGIMPTLSRGSIDDELTPPFGAKQSNVHNVLPLGRRNSIGNNIVRAVSRKSMGARPDNGDLARLSATHYGGQTPTVVPVRSTGPPDKMIVDPTTHAEASFRQRQRQP
ncbi:TPA: hypothetical protein ACH3X1_008894 [Trebouxia sp. C0004]